MTDLTSLIQDLVIAHLLTRPDDGHAQPPKG